MTDDTNPQPTTIEELHAARRAQQVHDTTLRDAVRREAQRAGFPDPTSVALEGDFSGVTVTDDGKVDRAEIRRRLADLCTYRPDLTGGRQVDSSWHRSSVNTEPDLRGAWDDATVTDFDKLFFGTT
ncbi:hypothetical protein AB0J52_33295 [Spirillospora sp. NPDC049652]